MAIELTQFTDAVLHAHVTMHSVFALKRPPAQIALKLLGIWDVVVHAGNVALQ